MENLSRTLVFGFAPPPKNNVFFSACGLAVLRFRGEGPKSSQSSLRGEFNNRLSTPGQDGGEGGAGGGALKLQHRFNCSYLREENFGGRDRRQKKCATGSMEGDGGGTRPGELPGIDSSASGSCGTFPEGSKSFPRTREKVFPFPGIGRPSAPLRFSFSRFSADEARLSGDPFPGCAWVWGGGGEGGGEQCREKQTESRKRHQTQLETGQKVTGIVITFQSITLSRKIGKLIRALRSDERLEKSADGKSCPSDVTSTAAAGRSVPVKGRTSSGIA